MSYEKENDCFSKCVFLTLAVVAAPMYFQLSCGKIIYSDNSYYDTTAEMVELVKALEALNC
ncbi:hypothetical protein [Culturomica massiliensis]|jgi:hypothetical protein|uniref:hypothetical protein n=1 Tax=Culturomica massiliensis TaxID=1841857 RepID=UPI000E55E57D|nr:MULTISPECIES: hypothetical protein [Odoribacteraceae]RHV89872.1 hypothetical protein DXA95_15780 [Odoribacter sp. OF09-27XD]